MSTENRTIKLQLVRSPKRIGISEEQFADPAAQGLLFPMPKKDLLIFLFVPRVTEEEFTKILESAKPSAILELRRTPRFDIGRMNRQEAFKQFETVQSRYYDLSSNEPRGGVFDPVILVQSFLEGPEGRVDGPILLLISESPAREQSEDEKLISRIARLFATASKHRWETVEVPQFA